MLDVCLLGCGGSMPTPDRYLTALFLSYNGSSILVDCGEGTQVSMKIQGCHFKNIDAILLTHYHADHVVGLPGLLLTIANSGRTEPLTIVGPLGLKKVIDGLTVISPNLPYKLELVEVNGKGEELKIKDMFVNTINSHHSTNCLSYSFEIKRKRKFDTAKAKGNSVPLKIWSKLQKGEDITYEGTLYTPDMVLGEKRKGLKVCYATDTRPFKEIVPFIKGADLFVCEGMYGDDGELTKAEEYGHMLFSEAACLAKEGEVKELWLTHFSPSLTNPEEYLEKASCIFPKTVIGKDRLNKELNYPV
ncbi:MAG TPA: ribonuclease Z [Clostridiaceae bacterium]|jgi:ribonuclease Z|nr:ribonuclease Z [Clostridiaceae bacterium]